MHVDSLACIRVKGGMNERFTIDNGVRKGCIMSLLPLHVYVDAAIKEVKMGM